MDFPPGKGGGERSDDDRLAARIVVIARPVRLGCNPVDSRDRLSVDDSDDSMIFFEVPGGSPRAMPSFLIPCSAGGS